MKDAKEEVEEKRHTSYTYTVYRWPLRMLKEYHEVIPIKIKIKIKIILLRSLLIDNPPSLGKVGHTIGVYVPYSFRTVVH